LQRQDGKARLALLHQWLATAGLSTSGLQTPVGLTGGIEVLGLSVSNPIRP
jgi:hypothetical protein